MSTPKIAVDPRACGRCGKPQNPSGRWEGACLSGSIDIVFPAQAFGALCGMKYCAEAHHFAWWHEGHPALVANEAQHVVFKWSPADPYKLCYECQSELLHAIGSFFGIPQRAEELRLAALAKRTLPLP